MEIAVRLYAFAVYLLYLLEIIEAHKLCKVPNGDAGTCDHISKCQPLMDLYTKKYKTPHENMYLQQSFCGSPGVEIMKMCCPSPSLWNKFQPNPVLYPPPHRVQSPTPVTISSPVFTHAETPTVAPEPMERLEISPASDELGTGPLPKEEQVDIDSICGFESSSFNKIVGGEAVAIDQYPWLALLQYEREELACGGSLISHRFVLTAAHCINTYYYGQPLHVRLAEYNTSSFPTDYVEQDGGGFENITVTIIAVKRSYPHQEFSRSKGIHDIALIELNETVQFTSDFIKPICLPDRNFIPKFEPNTNFTMAGWGSTGYRRPASEIKLKVELPYVPRDQCDNTQDPEVEDTQICAGGVEGKDSCKGDSGGPLMYVHGDRYYVVGVLSYGNPFCGTEGSPAIHTNVYHYISWINDIINGKISNN